MTDDIYQESAGPYPAVPAFTSPGGRTVGTKKKTPALPDEVFVRPPVDWDGKPDHESALLHCAYKPETLVELGKSLAVGVYKLVRTVRVSNNVSVTPE